MDFLNKVSEAKVFYNIVMHLVRVIEMSYYSELTTTHCNDINTKMRNFSIKTLSSIEVFK